MSALVDWMEGILEWLRFGMAAIFCVWIFALPPMLIFRRTRPYGAAVLLYSSFYTTFSCWWLCFVLCYRTLGGTWLLVGALLGGVGVIPLTFVGLMIKSFWTPGLGPWVVDIFFGIMLFTVPRWLGFWILHRCENRANEATRQIRD